MKLYWLAAPLLVMLAGVSHSEEVTTEFFPGKEAFLDSASGRNSFAVVFEDDRATGYFYALDTAKQDQPILDALHIYNVENVTDKDRVSTAKVIWSKSGEQAALLINDYFHAVFDFAAERGYCRTGFPPPSTGWSSEGHDWDDHALTFFSD